VKRVSVVKRRKQKDPTDRRNTRCTQHRDGKLVDSDMFGADWLRCTRGGEVVRRRRDEEKDSGR
jgi:hypothetical protein